MRNIGIYIHIPFCIRKCSYCDFLSAPADEKTMRAYADALQNEIICSGGRMKGYLADTVFIGGGTPSIMDASLIVSVLKALKENCELSGSAEITIECNPGTVTREKLRAYRKAGVNRLSIGLQSAVDFELRSLGRAHDYACFLKSFQMAREEGFNNINIDILFAIPDQTVNSYKKTLEAVMSLSPEHISAYSLIVEDGTRMKERVDEALVRGVYILPDEDTEREMYRMTREILSEHGYRQYEISNYARHGCECAHNTGYWERKPYLGFGIGAASLYDETRFSNTRDLRLYIDSLSVRVASDSALQSIEENVCPMSYKERMEEFMFLGLRMTKGVSLRRFSQTFGREYDEVYGGVSPRLEAGGFLKRESGRIRLTERGTDVSNSVMAEFLL